MPKAGTGKSTFGNEARTSSRGARNTEPRTGNVKVTSPPSRRSSPDSDFIQRMRFLIQQAGVASLSSMSDPSVVPTSHPTYPEQGHFTALPRSCQDLSQGPQSRGRATVRNMLSGFSSAAAGAMPWDTLCVLPERRGGLVRPPDAPPPGRGPAGRPAAPATTADTGPASSRSPVSTAAEFFRRRRQSDRRRHRRPAGLQT